MKNKNLLLERHSDLVNMLVRCRIKIEDREDPTVLDIMTDMRALEGIVTVRQTRPISNIVSDEQRIIELNVSYIPNFVKNKKDIFLSVVKSLKIVEGVKIVKIIEHDSNLINQKLQKNPLIL